MTIAVCYLSPEGVVLGADSTSTVLSGGDGPHYFNHAQKLFEIGENSTLGIVTWGLGTLFSISHRTVIAKFSDDLIKSPAKTVADAADRWAKTFWATYSTSGISNAISELKALDAKTVYDPNAVSPVPNSRSKDEEAKFQALGHNLKCGFCLAGHLESDRLPAAFQIDVDPLTGATVSAPLPMGNYRFWGVPNMIDRLIGGYDVAIRNSIVNSPLWTGTEADYTALMLQHNLQHDSLPIRDAIDFVHTCILSTIKSLKFSRYSQTCGGPIEIAVITSDRKFRWVRHKDWDVAITEGVAA